MAVALGPIVGGAIVHALTWQWIFWINVPIGIALLALTLGKIEESKGSPAAVDIVGLVLSTLGVVGLAQALLRGGDTGWTKPSIVWGIVGGLVVIAAFVAWERRVATPMMPLSIFRNRSFAGGCGASFALGAALYGQAFLFAQYLQFALRSRCARRRAAHVALGVARTVRGTCRRTAHRPDRRAPIDCRGTDPLRGRVLRHRATGVGRTPLRHARHSSGGRWNRCLDDLRDHRLRRHAVGAARAIGHRVRGCEYLRQVGVLGVAVTSPCSRVTVQLPES